MKRTAYMLTAAAASVGLVMAAPASAGQENRTVQDGLVNVAVTDTTVQIPIGVAANVCGVAVNVLATATNRGDIECAAEGVSFAESEEGNGNNRTRQNGLVNVALTDTTVQVPVAVAANICGVAVNVLSNARNLGDIDCEALADSEATA